MTHLHLETVFHRQSSDESWSIFTAYALDEESGEIVAETFETYRNSSRPQEGYRKSRGQLRINADKVPHLLAKQVRKPTQEQLAAGSAL